MQVYKLRALLRARGLGAIRAGTVDDYQGQEEKVGSMLRTGVLVACSRTGMDTVWPDHWR